jgi:hypothetical protein
MRSVEQSAQAWGKGKSHVAMYKGDIEWEQTGSGVLVARDALTKRIALPYEETDWLENLLTIGGASVQWQTLIGNGGSGALQYYNNANAYLSVGDSSTAAADTQTELQAATNRVRKAMDATYPLHTDTTGTAGSKSIVFRSTYATGDANFAWNEWGLFNSAGTGGPPTTGGRMLNRAAGAGLLGTKTSAATWVLTATLSLA